MHTHDDDEVVAVDVAAEQQADNHPDASTSLATTAAMMMEMGDNHNVNNDPNNNPTDASYSPNNATNEENKVRTTSHILRQRRQFLPSSSCCCLSQNTATAATTTPSCTYIRPILSLSFPIIAGEIFQNTLPIVDLAFVGRLLRKEDLAAAALATVWFNLWNATLTGFCTAVDTLLSQAVGAQHYAMAGTWTGHALLIVVGPATCLMAVFVALCEPVMKLTGQDATLAEQAGQFSYRLIPGLFPYFGFKVLIKHLQTQAILWPGVVIGILANAFNILANWLLISARGLHGAPVATTLTRCLEFMAISVYFYYYRHAEFLKQSWPTFAPRQLWQQHDADGTSALKTFLKLAASGALSFTAEAWSFEITTILAGLLGTTALDAHIITLSIATFLYLSFPFAIGVAASIQIGQWTGAGRGADAQQASMAAYMLTFVVQASLIILVLPSSPLLGDLFSSDQEVSHLVAKLLPLSCVFMMGDSIQSTTGGIMRGLGRQRLVFGLNVFGFWVLAVPVGALLTFVADIGVYGLWWGMSVGIYSSAALGVILLKYCIDWQSETVKAKNRMSTGGDRVEAMDHGSTMDLSER